MYDSAYDLIYKWHIKNLDHIIADFLISPEIQMPTMNNGFWQIVVYPRKAKLGRYYVHCGLRNSPVHTLPCSTTVRFTFEILNEDEHVKIRFGPRRSRFPRDNDIGHAVLPREGLFGPRELIILCRVTALDKAVHNQSETMIAKTEIVCQRLTIEVVVDDSNERTVQDIVVTRSLVVGLGGMRRMVGSRAVANIVVRCHRDEDHHDVSIVSAENAGPFAMTCVAKLIDMHGQVFASTNKEKCHFRFGDWTWNLPTFLRRTDLDNEENHLKNSQNQFTLQFDIQLANGDIHQRQDPYPIINRHLIGCGASIGNELATALNSNSCDWAIAVGDPQSGSSYSQSIKVHKSIVASRSAVFQAMLERGMVESRSHLVCLPYIQFKTLDRLIRFLYSGDANLEDGLNCDSVIEIYAVADMYLLNSLRKECSSFLQWNISTENVSFLKKLANLCLDEGLIEVVYMFKALHCRNKDKQKRKTDNTSAPKRICTRRKSIWFFNGTS